MAKRKRPAPAPSADYIRVLGKLYAPSIPQSQPEKAVNHG
jgi:hypothetical protein